MLLCIAGPTGVGKTDISLDTAQRLNGAVISADSMQIWRGLEIGTAKIAKADMRGIDHYMIDVVDPSGEYSVSDWVDGAKIAYKEILSSGKTPLIVGGTGMYIRALLYGYSLSNTAKSDEVRAKYMEIYKTEGSEYLYSLLKNIAPDTKIHVNDTKRIIRALEVFELTGGFAVNADCQIKIEHKLVVLNLDREVLYSRINSRVDNMLSSGLIEEVVALRAQGLTAQNQSMQAIGYKEVSEYLDGKTGKAEMIELLKKNTRNYAKRQLTYFRSFKNAVFIDASDKKGAVESICSVLYET